MQSKTCFSCKQDKPLLEFSKKTPRNQFSKSRQTHQTYCKACCALLAANWRNKNKGYRPSGKVSRIPIEDRLLMSAIRQRLSDARGRCKTLKRTMPTSDLSAEYLYQLFKQQGGNCALSGVPMSVARHHPLCLSLDKIDASKDYAEGNVQWLAWFVNRAKGEMSVEVFHSMCETVLEHRAQQ